MRFVVGSPIEHSVLGCGGSTAAPAATSAAATHGVVVDDVIAAVATTPIRRGSSWLVAVATRRMYFLVFAAEKSWSRQIVGSLPVAEGAVTEGATPAAAAASVVIQQPSGGSGGRGVALAAPQQQQQQPDADVLRLVETPIAMHFHPHRGQRLVIATTVRRLLIVELDAEMGLDTTPLTHTLDAATRTLTAPISVQQQRWCVSCEAFLPHGLIQCIDVSCGGKAFAVCTTSGHVFIVSWFNGQVLHQLPLYPSGSGGGGVPRSPPASGAAVSAAAGAPLLRKPISAAVFSTRLRLGAVAFLDCSIGIFAPRSCAEAGGARLPLDLSNPELQLGLVATTSSSASASSSLDHHGGGTSAAPTAAAATADADASVSEFLALNTKHLALASCGSRLGSIHVTDLSAAVELIHSNSSNNISSSDVESDERSDAPPPAPLALSPFKRLAQSIRNALVDLASSTTVGANVFCSAASLSSTGVGGGSAAAIAGAGGGGASHNPTFKQMGLGDVTSLCWSPDDEALCISFADAGVCVFHLGGSTLFHSWKHRASNFLSSSSSLYSAFASPAQRRGNGSASSTTATATHYPPREVLPHGCLGAVWVDNRRIVAVNRCGSIVTQLQMASAAPETTSPQCESDGNALLVGVEELWHYRPRFGSPSGFQVAAMQQQQQRGKGDGAFLFAQSLFASAQQQQQQQQQDWERLTPPASYIDHNYPLRYASASPDGSRVIACGRRGFALWSRSGGGSGTSSSSWKTFTARLQEQSFVVVAAPTWIGNEVVAVPVDYTAPAPREPSRFGEAGQCAVLFFAANSAAPVHLDSLIARIPLADVRPCLLTAAYRGGGPAVTTPAGTSTTTRPCNRYLFGVLDAHGNLRVYDVSVFAVVSSATNDLVPDVVSASFASARQAGSAAAASSSSGSSSSFQLRVSIAAMQSVKLASVPFVHRDDYHRSSVRALVANIHAINAYEEEEHTQWERAVQQFNAMPQEEQDALRGQMGPAQLDALEFSPGALRRRGGGASEGSGDDMLPSIELPAAYHIGQAGDVAQIVFLSPWALEPSVFVPGLLATGESSSGNSNSSKSASHPFCLNAFVVALLMHDGHLLLLDTLHSPLSASGGAGAAAAAGGEGFFATMFAAGPTAAARLGEILEGPQSGISRIWPAYVAPTQPASLEMLLAYGADGLASYSFARHLGSGANFFLSGGHAIAALAPANKRRGSSVDGDTAAAAASNNGNNSAAPVLRSARQHALHYVLRQQYEQCGGRRPTQAQTELLLMEPSTCSGAMFRFKAALASFDSESLPVGVCGSMPVWASSRCDNGGGTANFHPVLANAWLPCFDVSAQPSIALHLGALLLIVTNGLQFPVHTHGADKAQQAAAAAGTATGAASAAQTAATPDGQLLTRGLETSEANEMLRAVAGQLKRQRALVEAFDCVLYLVLHSNEFGGDPSRSSSPQQQQEQQAAGQRANVKSTEQLPIAFDRRKILLRVISFLRTECTSQDFFDIIVLTLRKTDEARWAPLFDVLGPAEDLFEQCIANNHLLCALHLLRILQMTVPTTPLLPASGASSNNINMLTSSSSKTATSEAKLRNASLVKCFDCARRLFGLVLRQYDCSVALDLLRFIVLIFSEIQLPTEVAESMAASSSSSGSASSSSQPASVKQQQGSSSASSSKAAAAESWGITSALSGALSGILSTFGVGGQPKPAAITTAAAPPAAAAAPTAPRAVESGNNNNSGSSSSSSRKAESPPGSAASASQQQQQHPHFVTSRFADAPPTAALAVHADLRAEVDAAAETFLLSGCMLRVVSMFDAFRLNVGDFFAHRQRYDKCEAKLSLSATMAVLLDELGGLPAGEFAMPAAEYVSVAAAAAGTAFPAATGGGGAAFTTAKGAIYGNELRILTPTHIALLEGSDDAAMPPVAAAAADGAASRGGAAGGGTLGLLVRLRHLFAVNKCGLFRLLVALLLLDVPEVGRTLEQHPHLRAPLVEMLQRDPSCRGYHALLKRI